MYYYRFYNMYDIYTEEMFMSIIKMCRQNSFDVYRIMLYFPQKKENMQAVYSHQISRKKCGEPSRTCRGGRGTRGLTARDARFPLSIRFEDSSDWCAMAIFVFRLRGQENLFIAFLSPELHVVWKNYSNFLFRNRS